MTPVEFDSPVPLSVDPRGRSRLSALARLTAVLLTCLVAGGCMSLSMFQGPEVLDPGELEGVVGGAAFSVPGDSDPGGDNEVGFWPEGGIRYGLGSGFDVSARFAGLPPFGAVYGDVRRQLLSDPFPVTLGFGASYANATGTADDFSFSALYPSLAVGTDRLWVAGRGIIVSSGSADEIFLSEELWGAVVGTSFGDGVRFLPELQVYFGPEETLVGLGLGLQMGIAGGDGEG